MRKTILTVLGAIQALAGLFGLSFGLVNMFTGVSLIVGALLLAIWVVTEGKKDFGDFVIGVRQTFWQKVADPAFWTALISGVLLPVLAIFKVVLTQQTVTLAASVLAILIPILHTLLRKATPATPTV
jgi:hypothetical protein